MITIIVQARISTPIPSILSIPMVGNLFRLPGHIHKLKTVRGPDIINNFIF